MKPETARAAAVLLVAAACLYLLRGVLPAIGWAGLIAVATWPLHERLERAIGGPTGTVRTTSALLLTSAAVGLLIVPLGWLVYEGVREVPALLRMWSESRDAGLAAPDWLGSLPVVGPWLLKRWNEGLAQPGALADAAHHLARGVRFETGRAFVAQLGHRAMAAFFCVLVLFFLYRDGDRLAVEIEAVLVRRLGPVGGRTLHLAVAAVRGTVNGLVLVGLAVGAVMSAAYGAAGVPHPALWGLATGLVGIVPFGAAVALGGVVLYLLATQAATAAVVLAAFGIVTIFVVDHFVRPLFIAGSSKLPLVLALLGIVAGLETFGVLGIFLGPTLLAVMTAVWRELAAPEP